jgi:hypothetical protein
MNITQNLERIYRVRQQLSDRLQTMATILESNEVKLELNREL